MLCKNLVSESSGVKDADASGTLTCSLCVEDELIFATDDDIRDTIQRLVAHKAVDSPQVFTKRQQALGFTYQEHGLLFDDALKDIVFPANQYAHDPMHCIFAGGVFNLVIFWFMAAVNAVTPSNAWRAFGMYLKTWHWPASTNMRATEYCTDERIKSYVKARVFKCSASEGLSLLPVFACWAMNVARRIPGVCIAACDAVAALCDVVEAIMAAPLGLVTSHHLRGCINACLQACVAAGWRPGFIPKFHWLVHFPRTLERFGKLPTCWVHERKHKHVKAFSADIKNTISYSRSVLSEVVSQQLFDVAQSDAFDLSMGLIHPVCAPRTVSVVVSSALQLSVNVLTSAAARLLPGPLCHKKDTVLVNQPATDKVGFTAGQVWFFAKVEGTDGHLALISFWELQSVDCAQGLSVWQMADNPALVDLRTVLTSVMWSESPGAIARVVVPFQFRGMMAE